MLSTALVNSKGVCRNNELLTFDPAGGKTCGAYIEDYFSVAGVT